MRNELQQKLFDKYPDMFGERHLDMSQTCMCWGIETNDGWYHILDYMCNELKKLQEKYDLKIIFRQVKEKYGTLRVYHHIEYGGRWGKSGDGLRTTFEGAETVPHKRLGWSISGKNMQVSEILDLIEDMINTAEIMSSIICERCGMTGASPTEGMWITTLCDKCKEDDETNKNIGIHQSRETYKSVSSEVAYNDAMDKGTN